MLTSSPETVKKPRKGVGRQSSRGRVKGAKSPLRVQSTSFSNFEKVRKTVSAGRKYFFDTLRGRCSHRPLRTSMEDFSMERIDKGCSPCRKDRGCGMEGDQPSILVMTAAASSMVSLRSPLRSASRSLRMETVLKSAYFALYMFQTSCASLTSILPVRLTSPS